MMWMLSASRARRWSSRSVGAAVIDSGDGATVVIKVPGPPKTKARDDAVPGSIFQRSLRLWWLSEQLDRYRGDLVGPDTTTRAGTAGSENHGTQILPPDRGECQTHGAFIHVRRTAPAFGSAGGARHHETDVDH